MKEYLCGKGGCELEPGHNGQCLNDRLIDEENALAKAILEKGQQFIDMLKNPEADPIYRAEALVSEIKDRAEELSRRDLKAEVITQAWKQDDWNRSDLQNAEIGDLITMDMPGQPRRVYRITGKDGDTFTMVDAEFADQAAQLSIPLYNPVDPPVDPAPPTLQVETWLPGDPPPGPIKPNTWLQPSNPSLKGFQPLGYMSDDALTITYANTANSLANWTQGHWCSCSGCDCGSR